MEGIVRVSPSGYKTFLRGCTIAIDLDLCLSSTVVSLEKPADVRRTFAKGSDSLRKSPIGEPKLRRTDKKTNFWPRRGKGKGVDYDFLEKCKEVVCRVKHPTAVSRHRDHEFRVSIMPWSRGSYLDIRTYKMGKPSGAGILLHLDVISAMLPEIIAAVRRMENEDAREPDKKAYPEVIRA